MDQKYGSKSGVARSLFYGTMAAPTVRMVIVRRTVAPEFTFGESSAGNWHNSCFPTSIEKNQQKIC